MADGLQTAVLDPERLRPFKDCVDNYGGGDEDDPWANNCLARDSVAYSNGLIARAGETIDLWFDPNKLARCRQLADEATALLGAFWPLVNSNANPRTEPYYMASEALRSTPTIDVDLIRALLGGALCPEATICVEPFEERGEWWGEVEENAAGYLEEEDVDEDDREYALEELATWRKLALVCPKRIARGECRASFDPAPKWTTRRLFVSVVRHWPHAKRWDCWNQHVRCGHLTEQ